MWLIINNRFLGDTTPRTLPHIINLSSHGIFLIKCVGLLLKLSLVIITLLVNLSTQILLRERASYSYCDVSKQIPRGKKFSIGLITL